MKDGQLTINGRPTFVSAVEPLVNDGLQVGDIWVDLFIPITKRCTSISPVTFTAIEGGGGPGGAPETARYITQTPDGDLTSEQALSLLATGIVKNTTTTGVLSIAVGDTDYTLPATTALKANIASPSFTGVVTVPTPFTLGATSVTATGTELNYMVGVTSGVQAQINTKVTGTGTHSGASSGTNTGDQTITLTGDVTGSGTGSFAATIGTGAVSLAKMANMATASLIYRKTGGSGAPEVNTLATLKTDLGLTGSNTGDQTISLTGDVTGSGTGSFAATIANDSVTYAKMQNVSATDRLLGRSTSGAGDVEEIPCTAAGRSLINGADNTAQRTTLGLGTLATQSGTFSGTSSGTNTGDQTSIVGITGTKAQFDTAVTDGNFLYVGDVTIPSNFGTIAVSGQSNVVADANSDTLTLVAGTNVTITTDASTDSITINASGGGGGVTDGDKGDITVSGTGATWTIDDGVVTLAKQANMATASLIGRNTGGTGVPEVLSAATAKTLLSLNNVENTALTTWAGSTNITTVGTIATGTWNATEILVGKGGSGRTSATAYGVLCGGTTSTGAHQSVSGVGTSGQVLTSNGASALPTWQDAAGGGGGLSQAQVLARASIGF